MAAVFLMQPLGQLLASVVGLAVLLTVGNRSGLATETDHTIAATIVDRLWRYVVGFGAIPALVAIGFRLTIPESPRFTLDVDHDGARALRDTERYYNLRSGLENYTGAYGDGDEGVSIQPVPRAAAGAQEVDTNDDDSMVIHDISGGDADEAMSPDEANMPDPFSWPELHRFFWKDGNIKYLLGTSVCWFLLDFAFFGLGINNPRVIAQIWSSQPLSNSTADISDWENPSDPGLSIYDVLKQDAIRSILTVSVGSLLGSIILVKAINYIPRKAWLVWSFIGMAVLFAVIGGSYFRAAYSDLHGLTITLYVLCQLLFNLGPNTLTFIIPAEIFPTRYRATCHGISAASGKLGSVVVQAFLPSTSITNTNSHSLGWILIGFSFAMGLGAVFARAWIPEVQNPRGSDVEDTKGKKSRRRAFEVPNKSLEELAFGMKGIDDGRSFGFRRRKRVSITDTEMQQRE